MCRLTTMCSFKCSNTFPQKTIPCPTPMSKNASYRPDIVEKAYNVMSSISEVRVERTKLCMILHIKTHYTVVFTSRPVFQWERSKVKRIQTY